MSNINKGYQINGMLSTKDLINDNNEFIMTKENFNILNKKNSDFKKNEIAIFI